MLKNNIFLIITIFCLSIFLSGCHEKKYTTVTFSSWGSITETKILNQLINDFEQNYPDIKIKFIHIPQNYFQKLHLLFVAQQEPDVIFINNLYLPIYADKLIDLDNYIKTDEFYKGSINALSYNEHVKAIPRDISTLVYYQNVDIINKVPKTINELFELNKYKNTKNSWALSYEPNIYYALPFVLTYGGNILNLNDNKTLTGLTKYKSIEGTLAPNRSQVGSSTLAQMFLDKKIAFYLSGRWMYPKISKEADFNWQVINFPGTVTLDASGWGISKNSKNIDSALKFLDYISSDKASEYFTQTGLIVPARIKTAQQLNNNKEKAFLNAINMSKSIDINKNYKNISDMIEKKYLKNN